MKLLHVSETSGIARFVPRPAADGVAKVWAVEERTLVNYLLPRDCPRLCFHPGPDATPDELALLGGAAAVVAIEQAWAARVNAASVWVYDMPAESFRNIDPVAGYWISETPVTPVAARLETDLPARIAARGAQLRVLDSLWPLHDVVTASGLAFSAIRMRNAALRPA
ncbi:DUF6886 family protein [Devosia sp.]|uniref:DUF6886 family protein n=1 Tax=Devosia sp. TaxID=1871048 RepID=UPI003A8F92A3